MGEDRLIEELREMRQRNAELEAIIAAVGDGIVIIDPEFKILYQNQAHISMLGDHVGEYCYKAYCRTESVCEGCPVEQSFTTGEIASQGRAISTEQGTLYIDMTVSPLRNPDGKIIACIKTVRDITSRKKSEEFTKNILDSMGEGLIVIDPEYRIISANKAFCSQIKASPNDIVGKHCYKISHHIDKPCYKAGEECAPRHTFLTAEPHTVLHTHLSADGTHVYVETKSYPIKDSSGRVTSVIETLTDITEKKKLEQQLLHAQKMEAVGTLAGGIAHDFNNILTAITGYGHLLKPSVEENAHTMHYLKGVLDAAERATQLTQALLSFSRKQEIKLKPSNLNEIIVNISKLLHRLIGEDIELKFLLADERLTIMADAGQIEQIIMNLTTNSRDAMPDGGTLTISTESITLDEDSMKSYGFGQPGEYALITVSDTGKGFGTEVKERIFEPFFTTKEVGKGTGLGLSIVYGIVKQHRGHINVYSEPANGTTFRIYLPLVDAEMKEPSEGVSSSSLQGKETILLAEDDAHVRELIKDVLQNKGYNVIEAVDGEDALHKFKMKSNEIQLLISDIVMPRMHGKMVYGQIRRIKPDIKAIFLSGYTADIIRQKGDMEEGMHFISKPVTPRDLLVSVREVLNKVV